MNFFCKMLLLNEIKVYFCNPKKNQLFTNNKI